MNYTKNTVDEIISNVETQDADLKTAFLAGVTKCLGSLQLFKANKYALEYEFKTEELCMEVYGLLKEVFDVELELGFKTTEPRIYTINVSGEFANSILKTMGLTHYENGELIIEDNTKYVENISNLEKAKSYIQGVFVSNGSVYFPEGVDDNAGYHVELVFSEDYYAKAIQGMLQKCGISLSYLDRESSYSIYGKSYQVVSDMLAFVRASNAVLDLSDINVNREVNNNLNRENNFQMANLDKTITASSKHIYAIELLDKNIGIDNLDEKMAKVCHARLENHDASLSELASIVGLTKSSLNRVLEKILKKSKEFE